LRCRRFFFFLFFEADVPRGPPPRFRTPLWPINELFQTTFFLVLSGSFSWAVVMSGSQSFPALARFPPGLKATGSPVTASAGTSQRRILLRGFFPPPRSCFSSGTFFCIILILREPPTAYRCFRFPPFPDSPARANSAASHATTFFRKGLSCCWTVIRKGRIYRLPFFGHPLILQIASCFFCIFFYVSYVRESDNTSL